MDRIAQWYEDLHSAVLREQAVIEADLKQEYLEAQMAADLQDPAVQKAYSWPPVAPGGPARTGMGT
jgi:ATP sulfurylase